MEFRILGPLEVVERGRSIELGGARQRALLVLLLTRANEVVSSDRLIDELWGDDPPKDASNALQYHVSHLRKALPADVIETRRPGYLIRVAPNELDLLSFERLVGEAQRSPARLASRLLRQALDLWRGPALGDLQNESFAQAEIRRLEELRLAAHERRLDADLALGAGAELVGELEALVHDHPFRESLRAQLMLALYRAGRQAEALDVYRQTRSLLVEALGMEPAPALRDLEQAILRHDPALDGAPRAASGLVSQPAIIVVLGPSDRADELLALAEPLARQQSRELILARLVHRQEDVPAAAAELAESRHALKARGVTSRVAAYTTPEPGAEAASLAGQYDADLLLAPGHEAVDERGTLGNELVALLERAPCDVGVLVGRSVGADGPVVTPFGGAEHDWSAIELAAWLAASLGTTLRLLGTQADAGQERRDASRLLARASLLVQQVVGIVTEPVLVPQGGAGVVEAARDARLLVVGLSDRWPGEGLGSARLAVAADAEAPVLFVRRGLRPSGIAPPETVTRFTWTLGAAG